jgi:hypothetical protein
MDRRAGEADAAEDNPPGLFERSKFPGLPERILRALDAVARGAVRLTALLRQAPDGLTRLDKQPGDSVACVGKQQHSPSSCRFEWRMLIYSGP